MRLPAGSYCWVISDATNHSLWVWPNLTASFHELNWTWQSMHATDTEISVCLHNHIDERDQMAALGKDHHGLLSVASACVVYASSVCWVLGILTCVGVLPMSEFTSVALL